MKAMILSMFAGVVAFVLLLVWATINNSKKREEEWKKLTKAEKAYSAIRWKK